MVIQEDLCWKNLTKECAMNAKQELLDMLAVKNKTIADIKVSNIRKINEDTGVDDIIYGGAGLIIETLDFEIEECHIGVILFNDGSWMERFADLETPRGKWSFYVAPTVSDVMNFTSNTLKFEGEDYMYRFRDDTRSEDDPIIGLNTITVHLFGTSEESEIEQDKIRGLVANMSNTPNIRNLILLEDYSYGLTEYRDAIENKKVSFGDLLETNNKTAIAIMEFETQDYMSPDVIVFREQIMCDSIINNLSGRYDRVIVITDDIHLRRQASELNPSVIISKLSALANDDKINLLVHRSEFSRVK